MSAAKKDNESELETAHLPSTTAPERVSESDSDQALPRHPQAPVYRCFLPDLAGFTGLRRVGPNPLYRSPEISAH